MGQGYLMEAMRAINAIVVACDQGIHSESVRYDDENAFVGLNDHIFWSGRAWLSTSHLVCCVYSSNDASSCFYVTLVCLRANDDFGRDDALSRTADFLSSCMSLENPLSVKGSAGNLIHFNGYT